MGALAMGTIILQQWKRDEYIEQGPDRLMGIEPTTHTAMVSLAWSMECFSTCTQPDTTEAVGATAKNMRADDRPRQDSMASTTYVVTASS